MLTNDSVWRFDVQGARLAVEWYSPFCQWPSFGTKDPFPLLRGWQRPRISVTDEPCLTLMWLWRTCFSSLDLGAGHCRPLYPARSAILANWNPGTALQSRLTGFVAGEGSHNPEDRGGRAVEHRGAAAWLGQTGQLL